MNQLASLAWFLFIHVALPLLAVVAFAIWMGLRGRDERLRQTHLLRVPHRDQAIEDSALLGRLMRRK